MPIIKATEKAVLAVPTPAEGKVVYNIEGVPGFMLVMHKHGGSYVIQRRVNGRSTRVTIGRREEMHIREATRQALEYSAKMRAGVDPLQERREAREEEQRSTFTLRDAWQLFRRSKPYRATTERHYERWLEKHLPDWIDRPMEELADRVGVRLRHEKITRNSGQVMANNVMKVFRAIYRRARREYPSLPEDPTQNVNWHKVGARDSALKYDELKPWYDRVTALRNPVKELYWLCVALTAGRRNQIASARWQDIDFKAGTWTFPPENVKGGKGYTIPVSEWLLVRLKEARGDKAETDWVFPATRVRGHKVSQSGHLDNPRNNVQGLPGPHALRHTYRSMAVIARIPDLEIRLLLNHTPRDVSEAYITRAVTLDHLRKAQEEMTAFMLKAFGLVK